MGKKKKRKYNKYFFFIGIWILWLLFLTRVHSFGADFIFLSLLPIAVILIVRHMDVNPDPKEATRQKIDQLVHRLIYLIILIVCVLIGSKIYGKTGAIIGFIICDLVSGIVIRYLDNIVYKK